MSERNPWAMTEAEQQEIMRHVDDVLSGKISCVDDPELLDAADKALLRLQERMRTDPDGWIESFAEDSSKCDD